MQILWDGGSTYMEGLQLGVNQGWNKQGWLLELLDPNSLPFFPFKKRRRVWLSTPKWHSSSHTHTCTTGIVACMPLFSFAKWISKHKRLYIPRDFKIKWRPGNKLKRKKTTSSLGDQKNCMPLYQMPLNLAVVYMNWNSPCTFRLPILIIRRSRSV